MLDLVRNRHFGIWLVVMLALAALVMPSTALAQNSKSQFPHPCTFSKADSDSVSWSPNGGSVEGVSELWHCTALLWHFTYTKSWSASTITMDSIELLGTMRKDDTPIYTTDQDCTDCTLLSWVTSSDQVSSHPDYYTSTYHAFVNESISFDAGGYNQVYDP